LYMSRQGRIHIVFIIDFLATREGVTGGTERQLLELISHLDKVKFRPILFCLQEFSRTPQWESIDCEKHVLHVYSLASWKGCTSFLGFIRFLKMNSVDIVQSYFHDATLFGIMAARIAGVRKTISCRRDMGFWYNPKVLRRLSAVNMLTSRILVNSQAVKDAVSRSEGVRSKKIDVMLNGIDLKAFDARKPVDLFHEFKEISPADKVVGMVANINREVKRGDLFVRAAGIVAKSQPKVKFLIIGSGKHENDLKRLIHELDLDGIFILGGKRVSAAEYIKSFDVGVLTSDSEGFSNVIMEYMAAGIPVVATDVGGNREIIKDDSLGLLVPPNDHMALAHALSCLLGHDGKRAQMGSCARLHIRSSFAWEEKMEEVTMYYQNLLGRP
jgi:L-malate glycosyltransferase